MIDVAIIVGAASGLVVFNIILVAWCLFCQRRQDAKLQTIDLQKFKHSSGKRVKFADSVKDSRNKYTPYPAIRKGPLPYAPSPLASAKVRTGRSDPPRAENLSHHKLSTLMPSTITDALSVYSDDTASVYSAASAPLETHDHLLRSHNPLNIIPVVSERPGTTGVGPGNVLFLPCSVNRLSAMEEGLNPETCHRSAWDQTPNPF